MSPTSVAWMALLTVCCWRLTSSDHKQSISAGIRLYNMLKFSQRNMYSRSTRAELDLRENRIFKSNPRFDCCPTATKVSYPRRGINPKGLLLELLHTRNFTQMFYETFCQWYIKDKPCQFIDKRYSPYARCEQQYSYQYAVGRNYQQVNDQFRIDFIRVATGCKCTLQENLLAKYVEQQNRKTR